MSIGAPVSASRVWLSPCYGRAGAWCAEERTKRGHTMKELRGLRLVCRIVAALALSGLPHHAMAQSAASTVVVSPTQADEIIRAAPRSAFERLLGPLNPGSQIEKDILAAALLDIEGQQLHRAAMAGDPAARARRGEIAALVNAYDAQYAATRGTGMPFAMQWRVLSGQIRSAQPENLMPPIRELYEAKFGARDAAGRQQVARMRAAEQAAAERARPGQAAPAQAAERAAAACGPVADGTRFDPNDIDKTLHWWIARTQELGAAQRSGNQIRVDAARQEFGRQLACSRNQRIRYTLRVQRHPVRDDPAISTAGVLVGAYHQDKAGKGVVVVGSERDARGITYVESVPILLRAGREIDPAVLQSLGMSSRFVVSARVVKTGVLGATSLRPPTLILFVDDVRVEQVRP